MLAQPIAFLHRGVIAYTVLTSWLATRWLSASWLGRFFMAQNSYKIDARAQVRISPLRHGIAAIQTSHSWVHCS
jgi:hypothetical protein